MMQDDLIDNNRVIEQAPADLKCITTRVERAAIKTN